MLLCYCCQRCHHVSGKRCLPNCDVVLGPLDFWRGDAVALRLLDCSMKCLMKFMTRQEATIGRNSTAVFKLVFCFHMSCFRFFFCFFLFTAMYSRRCTATYLLLILTCFILFLHNQQSRWTAGPTECRQALKNKRHTHTTHTTQTKRTQMRCDKSKWKRNSNSVQCS